MKKRTALSKKTRFEVFKRDAFTCQYCGSHPPAAILHVDHINPVSKGGDNSEDNLVTSCNLCNSGKGATLLTSVPKSLKDKAAEIAEQEAQIAGYSAIIQSKRDRIEDEAWAVADVLDSRFRKDGIDRQWFISIKNFIEKLGFHEVLDSMEIAVAKKRYSNHGAFKYFCGVCWNKIKRGENG